MFFVFGYWTFPASQLASEALQKVTIDYGMIDTWWMMTPSTREYSFYSAEVFFCIFRHKNFSRIDYIFASKSLFHDTHNAEILNSLSNHRAVLFTFSLSTDKPRAPHWCFNTTLLQNDIFKQELIDELNDFININMALVDDPWVLWNVVKGRMRNKIISFASHLNKARKQHTEKLETEITELEQSTLNNISWKH